MGEKGVNKTDPRRRRGKLSEPRRDGPTGEGVGERRGHYGVGKDGRDWGP